jgi:signal transduction histidine kinase
MLDEKTVRIAVSDKGCGIAEADKEAIFDKFRQLDGSITRETAGSGLGLAICKELSAMLAGQLGLESTFGEGSTFWIDIPTTLTIEKNQIDENDGEKSCCIKSFLNSIFFSIQYFRNRMPAVPSALCLTFE